MSRSQKLDYFNLPLIGIFEILSKRACTRAESVWRDHYKIPLSLLQVGLFVITEEMTSSEILHLLLSDDK